jgi:hypothetical protein
MAVPTGAVVENLDVVENVGAGQIPGRVEALLDALLLQAGEKGIRGPGVMYLTLTSSSLRFFLFIGFRRRITSQPSAPCARDRAPEGPSRHVNNGCLQMPCCSGPDACLSATA